MIGVPRAPKSIPQENAAEWLELLERAGRAIRHGQAAEAAELSGKEFSLVDARTLWEAYLRSAQLLWSHPEAVTDYFQQLWTGWAAAWNSALTGSHGKPVKDKRFRDDRWETEPVSRGLRDSYLALEKATDTFLSALPEESKDTLRVKFYTRQFLSAAAPSNFLMLNPAAREKFVATGGESLLAGFRNFVEDLERGDGRLDLNTDDRTAFKVGVNLATTPGKVVYQNALMQLIQYEPMTEEVRKRPFLFVPHWINKFYIQDLRPDNSVVRWLVERGHTVFLISWVNPTKEHAGMSFEDYMNLGPLAALDAIHKATGEKRCDIQGFCIGGILVMATAAYLKAKGDDRIATATTIATLVDFTDVGEIGVFVDRDRVEMLRSHLKEKGYLENHHLRDMFAMMRENDLVWSFHVMNYLMGDKPPAFDILYWNGDSTRLPAAMLLWYLEKDLYRERAEEAGPPDARRHAHRHHPDRHALLRARHEGGPHSALGLGLPDRTPAERRGRIRARRVRPCPRGHQSSRAACQIRLLDARRFPGIGRGVAERRRTPPGILVERMGPVARRARDRAARSGAQARRRQAEADRGRAPAAMSSKNEGRRSPCATGRAGNRSTIRAFLA